MAPTGLPRFRAVDDNLNVTAVVDEIPVARDAHGVYRVGGTRVTLDLVVRAFNRGATAEEIVQKYDSLRLPDVNTQRARSERRMCLRGKPISRSEEGGIQVHGGARMQVAHMGRCAAFEQRTGHHRRK